MKKLIKTTVVLIFLFYQFSLKSQDFKEFEQIKQLADLLSPEGDLAKEIKKFKDSTKVNFYCKVHIEEDTAILPYLVEVYTDVRVERVKPYVIFTINLVPKSKWTDFSKYTMNYSIEVSPDLQPLYDKLNRTIVLLNNLVSNIQAILKDIQTLRQNLETAIGDLQQGLEILGRMPEIIEAAVEKAKQNIINANNLSGDSINNLIKENENELNNALKTINGIESSEIDQDITVSEEELDLMERSLKPINEEELNEMKSDEVFGKYLNLSDSINKLTDLQLKIINFLQNAESYDFEKLTNDLSERTSTFLNELKEMIMRDESIDFISLFIEDYITSEIENIYNLENNEL